jgi:hypothetical protein
METVPMNDARKRIREDGVILSVELDRTSPNVEQELDAFFDRLDALRRELGFTHYVRLVEEEGDLVRVNIIPASPTKQREAEHEPVSTARELDEKERKDQRTLLGLDASKRAPQANAARCQHSAMRVAEMFRPRRRTPQLVRR